MKKWFQDCPFLASVQKRNIPVECYVVIYVWLQGLRPCSEAHIFEVKQIWSIFLYLFSFNYKQIELLLRFVPLKKPLPDLVRVKVARGDQKTNSEWATGSKIDLRVPYVRCSLDFLLGNWFQILLNTLWKSTWLK